MATLEEFKAQVTTEIEESKPLYVGTSDGLVEFTEEEYLQRIDDIANSRFNEQEFGYISAREQEYKGITDQLDQIFWAVDDGLFGDDAKTSQWYLDIQKVKTDNPKPS